MKVKVLTTEGNAYEFEAIRCINQFADVESYTVLSTGADDGALWLNKDHIILVHAVDEPEDTDD